MPATTHGLNTRRGPPRLDGDDLVAEVAARSLDGSRLFPLAWPSRPQLCRSRSSRLRRRAKRRLTVWKLACKVVDMLNRLHSVSQPLHTTRGMPGDVSSRPAIARRQAVFSILCASSRLIQARRGLGLTGVQALAKLLRGVVVDDYSVKRCEHTQVNLDAALVDEPRDPSAVELLAGLSWRERRHYEDECNVVDWTGKTRQKSENHGFL